MSKCMYKLIQTIKSNIYFCSKKIKKQIPATIENLETDIDSLVRKQGNTLYTCAILIAVYYFRK